MESPIQHPVIDMGVIAELRDVGGARGRHLLERVLSLFAERAPPAIDEVSSLARGNDLAALADAVHALKSMCASIGAKRAFRACHELEHLARRGAHFDAAAEAARLSAELALALREAETLRAA